MVPERLQKFIDRFARFPAVGPRLATRLAFYLAHLDAPALAEVVDAVSGLATLDRCPRCSFPKARTADRCAVCTDAARDRGTIALVERETDLISIERTRQFRGTYFLVGELPERGTLTPELRARLDGLKKLIDTELGGRATELVVAVGLNALGDLFASVVAQELKGRAEKITRIGRGIPTGGEIEFADEETLGSALKRRS
ncbi:MAG: toprim domain-containing protein [Patescibacteria group bacterium]